MKNFRLRKILTACCFVFTAFINSAAQRPNFDRPQVFDVENYTIRLSFDRAKKKIFGDTTVSLKSLKSDLKVVELDAVGLIFESVRMESTGIGLQYKALGGRISIALDRPYAADEIISVRLKYSATPKKGIFFNPPSRDFDGVETHSAQIYSQNEPDGARHWFPSFDFPNDKATTEEYLTVENGMTAIGNGELVEKRENQDETATWHYKMSVPHSTYLMSFVIGHYSRVEDKYGAIPLGFYVYPGREATARKAFGDTARMIEVYERLTGVAFPYNKYDQTVVAHFQLGGMENITATTLADNEIFLVDFDFAKGLVTDLVSHELAHSWFGDLVTCRNWAELWLNEGFATYMESAYREQVFGRESYERAIRQDAAEFLVSEIATKNRKGLYNLNAGDVDKLFDNTETTYNKGGVVLHMLREQVGTENFWKGVNLYLNRNKFGLVGSSDLQKAMEDSSGQDLGWFFDQWVYSSGAPWLDVKPVFNTRTKTFSLTVAQTQRADSTVPAAFKLSLDLKLKIPTGDKQEKLDITKRVQTFTFKTNWKPSSFDIDEDGKVPLIKYNLRPMATQ